MNVIQMISSGGFYGAERMMVHLSATLAEMGCRVLVAVFCNELNPHLEVAKEARRLGLEVEEIQCRGRMDRTAIRQIAAMASSFGACLVHSHGYKPNMYARLALGLNGPKLVSTCHGFTDETRRIRLNSWLDCRLLRAYHAISAVSDGVRDRLVESGIPASQIRVINNGISFGTFAHAAPSLERRQGQLLVGFVGRLIPLKNPLGFLAAARYAAAVVPHARFLYIGDGPDRAQIEQLSREWDIEDRVSFLGFRADMPSVYASLDLLVLPSFTEGLPMSILECMAAGRPVIATRVGAVDKLVQDGVTGVLLDPNDQPALDKAVVRLLQDRPLAEKLAAAGQQLVREQFSTEAMTRQYLDLYRYAGAKE
ncbi:MAG: glycosyltransferase family 4 protein [Acidobacteriota bacterium]